MTAMGTVSVLLFHSVVAGELSSPPVNPTAGKELAHPSVQLAQGWRYRHFSGWQPAPTYVSVCEGYECSPHYNDRELPWRPVSLSLSAGFAHSDGGDVTVGGSGGALGVRLGAGLVGQQDDLPRLRLNGRGIGRWRIPGPVRLRQNRVHQCQGRNQRQ